MCMYKKAAEYKKEIRQKSHLLFVYGCFHSFGTNFPISGGCSSKIHSFGTNFPVSGGCSSQFLSFESKFAIRSSYLNWLCFKTHFISKIVKRLLGFLF